MLERIASTVFLKPAAAEYAERARYYRQRAVVASVSQGIFDHIKGNVQGVDMVDVVDGVEVLIPGTDKSLQFAFDKNGIAFARIEGGKYYSISDSSQQAYLDMARVYDLRSKSFLRRVFNRRFESLDRSLFDLSVQTDKLSDRALERLALVHETLQYLKEKEAQH